MPPLARLVSLSILTIVMVFLGVTFFQVIAPFLLPLFLAGIVAVTCQPVFRYFLKITRQRPRVSAGLTTLTVLATILIPLLFGTFTASVQMYALARNALGGNEWRSTVTAIRNELQIDHLASRLIHLFAAEDQASADSNAPDQPQAQPKAAPNDEPVSAPAPAEISAPQGQEATPSGDAGEMAAADDHAAREQVDQLQLQVEKNLKLVLESLAQRTLGIAGAAAGAVPGAALNILGSLVFAVLGTAMFVIALYYFLADGPQLLAATESLIPVHIDYQRELREQFGKVVRSVVLATLLAALLQGLLTAAAVSVAGVGHFFALLMLATVASLVPPAGSWLVWGPCALWLVHTGDYWSAGFLTVFGVFVIGTIDNVLRVYLLHSDIKLHPLLAFVSVFGGLQMMGLWGVFIGPMVACFLYAIVRIFNTELKEFSKQQFGQYRSESPDHGRLTPVEAKSDAASPVGKTTAAQSPAPATSESGTVAPSSRRIRRRRRGIRRRPGRENR